MSSQLQACFKKTGPTRGGGASTDKRSIGYYGMPIQLDHCVAQLTPRAARPALTLDWDARFHPTASSSRDSFKNPKEAFTRREALLPDVLHFISGFRPGKHMRRLVVPGVFRPRLLVRFLGGLRTCRTLLLDALLSYTLLLSQNDYT